MSDADPSADDSSAPDDRPADRLADRPRVAALGSLNLDRTRRVSRAAVDRLEQEWTEFPAAGASVAVDAVPEVAATAGEADDVRLGGTGANAAVAAARQGADAALFGAVGSDAETHRVRERLREAGVDPDALATKGPTTGTAHIWVTPDGENRIAVRAGANARVDPTYVEQHAAALRAADALLLGNELPVEATLAALDRLRGSDADDRPVVVLDPAPAEGAEPLVTHPAVDVVTPNEAEFQALARAGALTEASATVVRTEGDEGATIDPPIPGADERGTDTDPTRVPAPAVDAVDTTGAGDAFAGALAAALGAGTPLADAVARAAVAGALACEREGAMTAPTAAETDERLA